MRIQIADGSLSLEVLGVEGSRVKCRVANNFVLNSRKNVCIPNMKVDLPTVSDQEKHDIQNFAVKHKLDFIALSFVQSAKCVQSCRDLLQNTDIKIISKIENIEGLRNIDEILGETDGIMIARGDLGMELSNGELFLAQKYL